MLDAVSGEIILRKGFKEKLLQSMRHFGDRKAKFLPKLIIDPKDYHLNEKETEQLLFLNLNIISKLTPDQLYYPINQELPYLSLESNPDNFLKIIKSFIKPIETFKPKFISPYFNNEFINNLPEIQFLQFKIQEPRRDYLKVLEEYDYYKSVIVNSLRYNTSYYLSN